MAGSEARQRIREKRQQQIREQHRRSRRVKLYTRIGVPVAALAVIALVFALVANLPRGGTAAAAGDASAATVAAAATSVPAAVLDTAGAQGVAQPPKPVQAPPLTADGKPEVLYVGAEYCPFCAAERWPVVVALSRFGTFHSLGLTSSESNDAYPDTATLSFHGASYTSDYISFTGKEIQDRQGKPLEKLSPAQQKVFQVYDAAPYTQSAGAIPFVDLGGAYLLHGASYDPQVLHGKTHLQIARALHDPDSAVAKSVDPVANAITAGICTLTHDRPATVCTSAGVKAAAKLLK